MKRTLLSVLALATMSLCAVAQQWTPPVDPASAGVDATDGGTYYVKNVGCGQYLTGANNWATQISVTSNATPYMSVVLEAVDGESPSASYYDGAINYEFNGPGFRLKLNGTFYFSGGNNRNNWEVSNTYLFRDTEQSGFIDYNNQNRDRIFVLSKDASGYYRIQSTSNNNQFPNARTQYAYASAAGQAVRFDMTEAGAENLDYLRWAFIPTSISADAIALYNAQKALYDKLNEASQSNIDCTEAAAVYGNADATIAQLEAATMGLQVALNRQRYAALFSQDATEENPQDITEHVLTNPNFDGHISGWVCTFVSGQTATNIGYQANSTYTNGNVTLDQFIESWQANTATKKTIGNGLLYQTIYGLPVGKYRLEADVIAVDQYQGNYPVTGAYLYITAGQIETRKAVATGNGMPEHFATDIFVNDGSDAMTFGLKTISTTANWIAADNFRIYYLGALSESVGITALKAAIEEYADPNPDQAPCNAQVQGAFNTVLEASVAMTESDDNSDEYSQQCLAQVETLRTAYDAVVASVTQYVTFAQNIAALGGIINDEMPEEVQTGVGMIISDLEENYDSGTLTQADIDGSDAAVKAVFKAYLAQGLQLGQDISWMIRNRGFDQGTEGWHIWSGDIVVDAQWSDAERYHAPFQFDQILTGLPAGKYEVSVQGFSRDDADAGISAQLTAQVASMNASVPLQDLYAEGSSEKLCYNPDNYDDETIPYDKYKTLHDGSEAYVPNSMQGSRLYFDEGFYTNTTTIEVGENEDLAIGIQCSNDSEWVIWDNFRIIYSMNNVPEGWTELQNAVAEVKEAGISQETVANADIVTDFTSTLAQAETMLEEMNAEDDYQAMAAMLRDSRAAVTSSINDYARLNLYIVMAQQMNERIDANVLPDVKAAVEAVITEMQTAYDERTATAEQILAWQSAAVEAARETFDADNLPEGTDITFLLNNPSFDDSTNGWSITREGGNTGTVSVDDGVDYHEVEFWRSLFDCYQTIPNLPSGIYDITVQGFSRNEDDQANPNADIKIELYAGNSTAKFMNLLDATQVRPIAGNEPLWNGVNPDKVFTIDDIEYYAPNGMGAASAYFATVNPQTNEPFYTNHIKVILYQPGDFTIGVRSFNQSEWTLFDNFQITYLGSAFEEYIALIDEKTDALNAAMKDAILSVEAQDIADDARDNAADARESEDVETMTQAMEQLDDALPIVQASAAIGARLLTVLDAYNDKITEMDGESSNMEIFGLIDEIETNLNEGTIESDQRMETWMAQLPAAWMNYLLGHENWSSATPDNPFDVSFLVANNDFKNYFQDWNVACTYNDAAQPDFEVVEFYGAEAFRMEQQLANLKPGKYMLTVNTFYRQDDENPGTAFFFAGDNEAPVMAWDDTLSGAVTENPGYGGEYLNEETGTYFYAPYDREAFLKFIEDGRYLNSLTFNYEAEDGNIAIGFYKDFYAQHDWIPIDNVKLYYLGAPDEVRVTMSDEFMAYSAPVDLDFSESELKAYIISAYDRATGDIFATRVNNVPAGTGLLLAGSIGTYKLPTQPSTTYLVNLLMPALQETSLSGTTGGMTNLVLNADGNEPTFDMIPAGTVQTLAAGSAYLQLPTQIIDNGVKGFRVVFHDDDTGELTAIRSISTIATDEEVYTLSGQKLSGRPAKAGLYIIGGRKVMVK